MLSRRGYEKVQQIVEGDEVLKHNERDNPMFGKDIFYMSILGTPSEKEPWMLQFGGHHLALNITVAGEQGILTPTLTGAQPALYTIDGKTIRPLGQESDKALALLNALDEGQRKQAILSYRVADLVLGPGQDGKTIQPEGLKASAMNSQQRTMLMDLVGEWANIVHESAASAADGPTQGRAGRHVVRLEREYYRRTRAQHHGLLPDSGTERGHRVCAATVGRRSFAACPYHVPRPDQRLRQEGHRKVKRILAAALLLSTGQFAFAHRLDEYLQATLISVEKTRALLKVRLTPGVAIVPIVLAEIDRNGDGVMSEVEQREYAERVVRDLVVTAGGERLTPRPVSAKFPTIEEMRDGSGEIQLQLETSLRNDIRNRSLTFENGHMRQISAYLANALVPSDPSVRIAGQYRNSSQSLYRLDYVVAGAGSDWAVWGCVRALGLLLLGRVVLSKRAPRF